MSLKYYIHIQDTKLVTVILSVHNFTFLLLAKIFDIVKIDVKVQTLEWTCKRTAQFWTTLSFKINVLQCQSIFGHCVQGLFHFSESDTYLIIEATYVYWLCIIFFSLQVGTSISDHYLLQFCQWYISCVTEYTSKFQLIPLLC